MQRKRNARYKVFIGGGEPTTDTTDSLKNKSSRPHTPHPNAHTPEETAQIAEVFKSHPDISYAEALGILRIDYGYARTYGGFYRFLMKHKIRPVREINPYIAKPYRYARNVRRKNANGRQIRSVRV